MSTNDPQFPHLAKVKADYFAMGDKLITREVTIIDFEKWIGETIREARMLFQKGNLSAEEFRLIIHWFIDHRGRELIAQTATQN